MTESEQNLWALYLKLGGKNSDIPWTHHCIREVALATLKDIRPYLSLAQQNAEARYDSDSEDRGSYAMYDIMCDTERLIEQIDLLIAVSEE